MPGYALVGTTETYGDGLHDWSVAVKGYRLFRKDSLGRQ